MTKTCPRCKKVLDEIEFNWKIKDIRRSVYCKICSRKYIAAHYQNNIPYYLRKAKIRNSELREQECAYIGKYLLSHPCIECGEKDILVLEFDHRDRKTKKHDIHKIFKNRLPLNSLIEEIAKCDVRCANCHRRKTEKEDKSWKLKYAPVA